MCTAFEYNCLCKFWRHRRGRMLKTAQVFFALGTSPQALIMLTNLRGSLFWRQRQERTHSVGLSYLFQTRSALVDLAANHQHTSPKLSTEEVLINSYMAQITAVQCTFCFCLEQTTCRTFLHNTQASKQGISCFTHNAKL